MKLALTLLAATALLSACAGLRVSTEGGDRAEPGAHYSQGARS